MRAVDGSDPRSPSVQIADDIRSQIEDGELAPGARLAPTRALASQYGVALMTLQTALGRLRGEGRVYSTGRGYFVSDSKPSPVGEDQRDLSARLQEVEAKVRDLRARVEALETSP